MTLSTRLTSSLLAILTLSLSNTIVLAQEIQFCGEAECRVPLEESCSGLKANHDFFGSCCHLEDITGTGGCRVTIWNGNCAWARKCGACKVEDGCNVEYRTSSTADCLEDRFRVLGGAKPTSAPVAVDNSTSANGTMADTPSPTAPLFPTMAPTCPAESEPPVAGQAPAPAPSGAATTQSIMMNAVVGGAAAMTMFGMM